MNRFPWLLLAIALTTTATVPLLLPPTSAQVDTDLRVVNVTVGDAIFDAPDPVNVTATIHNNGSSAASGVIHFRYNASDQSLTNDGRSDQPFNTTEPLGPGESVNVTITWNPSQAQVGPGNVLGILTSASDDTPDNNEAADAVFVERYALNATVLDDREPLTLPGRTTGFGILVENTGNAPLEPVASVAKDAPRAWTADAPAVEGVLQPGESVLAYGLVTPPDSGPDDLPDGTKARATLEWSARANPNANTTLRLPNTTVQREPSEAYRYGVTVSLDTPVVPVNNQAATRTIANVTNTGNVVDVFTVDATAGGALAPNLTLDVARDTIVLSPGTSIDVPVTIALSGDPPTDWHADLTVEVGSVNDRLEPEAANTTTADVRVAAPDLQLEAPTWPDPVYQDDGAASLEVPVHNTGQGPVPSTNLTVQAVRGGFPFAEGKTTVPALAAGETTTVTAALPVGNLSGAYEVQLSVDPGDHVDEPVEADNTARVDAFVRTADLGLDAADGIQALPGQFIRYERPPHVFYVHNRGNAREQITVDVQSAHGWISETQSVVLAPGAREPIAFSLVVPERPGTQSDAIRLSATLTNRTSVVAEASTSTEIVDKEPPRLVDVDIPENVTATQPFPVRTEWTDAVGIANATVLLTSPGNSTSTVQLTRQAPGVWTANATVFELGTYEVRFRATDASRNANTFKHANPLRLTASYAQDPTLRFTDPEGERVTRAGDPIPLEVHDPAGIASVRYEAAGSSGELAAPFAVPTEGWSSGEHTVTVTAENRFGRTTETQAVYTVDNTPPEITRLTVQPDGPDPGQLVTVTVHAEGDPTGGRVQFRDASDVTVAEANLSAEENGQFTASATLGEGEVTALVTVQDQVGNVATREVDIEVGGNALPSPGGLLAALVVAGAALVLQRRRRWSR